jgi:AraC-like DNA-binding protein
MSQDALFPLNAGFATATYTSSDPDEFASLSRTETVDVIDTGPGPFHAWVTRVNLNRIWMQRGSESVPFLARIKHPAERIGISFLKPASAQSMLQATMVSHHDLAMLSCGQPISSRSLGGSEWATISLPADDFIAFGRTFLNRDVDVPGPFHISLPSALAMGRLQRIHETIIHLARTKPQVFVGRNAVRDFEEQLLHALFATLSAGKVVGSDSCAHHAKVLAQFQEYLEAHPENAPHMTDVCSAIGVAGRTLRFVCSRYLGMSPKRYLKFRRMHLARRALIHGTSDSTTVTNVAMQFDFWELGRFSVTYRTMFGESPAETLRAPPERFCRYRGEFPMPKASFI